MSASYSQRRSQLETYFDRTAVDAWARLTSEAPVSGIRATVRAGRHEMRQSLLNWLPDDLNGKRVLDAGCGTGAFAVEAARRGAQVVAIDISPTLIALARERLPHNLGDGSIEFKVGDMLDPALGVFDYAVAMDSLIHYRIRDVANVLAEFASTVRHSMLFTFVPRTAALTAMHVVGRLFPRGNRAPAVEPVSERALLNLFNSHAGLRVWRPGRSRRITSGFYISQALELSRK